jgi:hypothetical protein
MYAFGTGQIEIAIGHDDARHIARCFSGCRDPAAQSGKRHYEAADTFDHIPFHGSLQSVVDGVQYPLNAEVRLDNVSDKMEWQS